jgi:hypothetical protein
VALRALNVVNKLVINMPSVATLAAVEVHAHVRSFPLNPAVRSLSNQLGDVAGKLGGPICKLVKLSSHRLPLPRPPLHGERGHQLRLQ